METTDIDALRVAKPNELGRCTDDDYFLIRGGDGKWWQTESLKSGEQVKREAPPEITRDWYSAFFYVLFSTF